MLFLYYYVIDINKLFKLILLKNLLKKVSKSMQFFLINKTNKSTKKSIKNYKYKSLCTLFTNFI